MTIKKSDCVIPLALRQMLPGPDAEDVPIDARLVLSVIGWGTAEDFELSLRPEGGDVVEGAQDGWCYQHEGDWEVHCTLTFQPDALLSANTGYEVRAEPTDSHLGDGTDVIESAFTTGEDGTVPTKSQPDLSIENFQDRPKEGVDACDWQDTQQYDLLVSWSEKADADPSVLQVYQVNDDGSEENVHTVFPMEGESGMEFRQVMDPALDEDIPNCYRVELEDVTGSAWIASDTVCWEVEDTGTPDTGSEKKTEDTGLPKDTGLPGDTGEDTTDPTDTGTPDTGADTGPPLDTDSWEVLQPASDFTESCQCGAGPLTAGWPLIALAWAVMVRRG